MTQVSDDVFAISSGATKLMFCENSLTLRRWVTSFHGVYLHGSTLFSHRNMSQQATLYESLLQSGQLFRTTQSIVGNADRGEVHAGLLDWNWPASLLVDSLAIRYTPQGTTKQNSVETFWLLLFLKKTAASPSVFGLKLVKRLTP